MHFFFFASKKVIVYLLGFLRVQVKLISTLKIISHWTLYDLLDFRIQPTKSSPIILEIPCPLERYYSIFYLGVSQVGCLMQSTVLSQLKSSKS